jgi:hypothetical protein
MAPQLMHPLWCHSTYCTADADALTSEGYKRLGHAAGAHMSWPLELGTDLHGPDPGASVSASLYQPVAPWPTVVWLRFFGPGEAVVSVPAWQALRPLMHLHDFLEVTPGQVAS